MRTLLIGAALLLPLLAQAADQELLERGKYLARAADCVACHSIEGGADYAGGLPLASPFGTIYGTNITPDLQHGIGHYSADDLFNALTEGKRPDGSKLYPAMPYTSYHLIKREDSDAIYAYLMSLEPIAKPSPQTSLAFPFNLRFGLAFWNMIYKDRVQLQPTEGKSAAWQQGQYLVEVLGHCGECHTPRSITGALEQDKRLQGGELLGYLAPSLLADDLAARGWNPADLATFLKYGISAQGSMFNEMYPVFHHSIQHLPQDDHHAMATFLMGDQPPPTKPVVPQPLAQLSDSAKLGRQDYLNVCAGCHGGNGEGVPHVAVALNGNTTLRLDDPRNLLRVIDDGIHAQQFSGFERMQPMPGFVDKLSAEQLSNLLNYLRESWGGLPGDLSTARVTELRAAKAH
ncbi:MAG: cytochrome c [Pseudomonas sp.]